MTVHIDADPKAVWALLGDITVHQQRRPHDDRTVVGAVQGEQTRQVLSGAGQALDHGAEIVER